MSIMPRPAPISELLAQMKSSAWLPVTLWNEEAFISSIHLSHCAFSDFFMQLVHISLASFVPRITWLSHCIAPSPLILPHEGSMNFFGEKSSACARYAVCLVVRYSSVAAQKNSSSAFLSSYMPVATSGSYFSLLPGWSYITAGFFTAHA